MGTSANNGRYKAVSPTSVGVRLTPMERGRQLHMTNQFYMQATSAETNALSPLASLGMPVKVLTALVDESPIATFIARDLAARGMEVDAKPVPQGDAWGHRHQFNIADMGYGLRAPALYNDRAGEVGRTLSASDFNLEALFFEEGVELLHLSGLIAALSPETGDLCLKMAQMAKRAGTRISFDLNYRASFWAGREQALAELFHQLAAMADILVGGTYSYQACFDLFHIGKDKEMEGAAKAVLEEVKVRYKHASLVCATLRQEITVNEHLWGAVAVGAEGTYEIAPRSIPVLDRIGGGDGFMGGLLYGVLKEYGLERSVQFGWACGTLAATVLEDYICPASEADVWRVWEGNTLVRR